MKWGVETMDHLENLGSILEALDEMECVAGRFGTIGIQ